MAWGAYGDRPSRLSRHHYDGTERNGTGNPVSVPTPSFRPKWHYFDWRLSALGATLCAGMMTFISW